jgi:hypothetical protein
MKHIIIVCFVFFYSSSFLAHETNQAFFLITQKENTIEIEAEFPWTMRNALIAYNPSLEKTASKKDFNNTFIEYIKANLILKNKSGENLEFRSYKELENNGHSHQNSYLLVFSGSNLIEVTNTIMFNIYENQVNYNKLTINSKTYKTSGKSVSFNVNHKQASDNWYLLILILPILFFGYKFYQKTTGSKNN